MNLFLFITLFIFELTARICASNCENFLTCSACIQSFDRCLWCPSEKHVGARCQSQEYHLNNGGWCKSNISIPEIKTEIIENYNWSTAELGGKIIQFRPQYVKLKSASPGIPITISMSYKPAKDEPLDVYYLMDNSINMQKYKRALRDQATSIFEELKNLTNNVRLGFGTFVEKPALPYANPDKHNAYSFKNHIPLTNDTKLIISKLEGISVGSNFDIPEAVLDGLMQVMLCKKDIKWRKGGRRFIVVATNAFYHSAGDGKMVGALKRHDMKCHIDGKMDTILDYPSVGQVNKAAKEGGYTIIFAVDNDSRESYNLLSKKIVGAKPVLLTDKNIASIITEQYIKVIEKFQVTHNASSLIQVTTRKNCEDCKAMHYKPLDLKVTFKVMSCPSIPKTKDIVKISPTSLNDGLIVEIEFKCQCECESNNFVEFNSTKCNKAGKYQCGICNCNPNRYGDTCACEGNSVNTKDDSDKCKKNINDILECSGHGECSCGSCVPCHKGFSGPFCEFDDNSCSRRNGLLCSGHGTCTMGKCQCNKMWKSLPGSDDCGCLIDQTPCIAPFSGKICSGHGICECGHCTCSSIENSNNTCKGRFCDRCQGSDENRCEELEDYAFCNYLNKTTCNDEYNQIGTKVLFANRTEINSANNTEWYMATLCRVKKGDDSIFIFKYFYTTEETDTETDSESDLVLVIQNDLDKMPPANIWVAIGSSIGGILLIGLLSFILWKVLTDIYDAREYNQFVEKARAAGYDVNMTDNPWYEPPVQTFNNPVYNNK